MGGGAGRAGERGRAGGERCMTIRVIAKPELLYPKVLNVFIPIRSG